MPAAKLPPRPSTARTGSAPPWQYIPMPPSVMGKRRRFMRDQIKQHAYLMSYGTGNHPIHDEAAHVVTLNDDYNVGDRSSIEIYGIPFPTSGRSGAFYYSVETSLACGHCPRSMRCLRGMPPRIICPRCRRTNRNDDRGALWYLHARSEYWRIQAQGNLLAHHHDYVPPTCPLWLRARLPVAVTACPICRDKRRTVAIYVKEPKKRKPRLLRLLRRSQRLLTEVSYKDYLRRHQKEKHATKFQQALRRPSHCAGARAVQQRQPQHRCR